MNIRVQMPDINNAERWKRGAVRTVKSQAAAAELVAQGGTILLQDAAEDQETEAETATSGKSKGGK